ncbi:hypothetical protein ACA910_003097 [Epithemia clementina (nom. ined.)]
MSRSNERQFQMRCNIHGGTNLPASPSSSSFVSVPCAVSNYGQSYTAVIVTHPWGPLGGNMHNNVVVASALYFQKMGFTTCRFNFLPHQWINSTGLAHVEQVKQAAHMMLHGSTTLDRAFYPESATDEFVRPNRIILVGYSYGSLISGSASLDIPECVATIAIAPPFAVQMWLLSFRSDRFLERSGERPDIFRFFVIGDNDNFTSESYFQSTLDKRLPIEHTDAAVISGADHFFRQREKDLMAVIGQWLRTIYASECQGGDLKRLSTVEVLPHASSPSSPSLVPEESKASSSREKRKSPRR